MRQEPLSEALAAAHESLNGRASIAAADFYRAVSDWECIPVTVCGKTVGAILRNGPEIHACIKPEGFCRWIYKSQLRVLEDTIKKHGYAQTSVEPGNMEGHNFVIGLGFKKISDSPKWVYRKVKNGH